MQCRRDLAMVLVNMWIIKIPYLRLILFSLPRLGGSKDID